MQGEKMINWAYTTYSLYLQLLLFILLFFKFHVHYLLNSRTSNFSYKSTLKAKYVVFNFLTYAIKGMQFTFHLVDKPCKQRDFFMSSCQLRFVLSFELLNEKNAVYIRPISINIILCTYCQLQTNLFLKI